MQKLIYYRITQELEQILNRSLHNYNGGYAVKVAAKTNHGDERITERSLSEKQKNILKQIALKRILFHKEQISEVRVLKIENQAFPVSVVVDDVVIGVHPKNLPFAARNQGFGTREGENFAVMKTVLARPNGNCGRKFVGDFEVVS